MKEITEAMLESAGEAVSLCIATGGVMAFWTGMMEVAESAGLIRSLTKKMDPFIRFLFPAIPKEHEARKYISLNIIANILGLGWACTPAGLKAMEALAAMEKQRSGPDYEENRASNEMCTFLILNISSLQLIPVNMIAYRQQYGGGGYLLQSEGSEKQLPERCKIILKYEALHAKTDSSFYIFRAVIDKEAFFRMQ